MSCKVELIPITEGNCVTIKKDEKIIVGRGSSLGCNDKKISRQHAELFLKKDETLWIKPTHTNPVFFRPIHGKTSQLTKDIEQELKDGDQIGLLPTSFFFRVNFSKDINSTSLPDESETTNSDSKSRKLPNWMSTSDDRSSVKRKLSVEKNNDSTNTNEPSTTSDTSTAIVPDKSSKPKTFDSESDDGGFDSVAPKKIKSNDKHRPACQYGASCYRKNAAHRTEQSHPGDSDYEDEKDKDKDKDKNKKDDDDDDDDKPQCPYGKTCYRQNPQHKRDYKH